MYLKTLMKIVLSTVALFLSNVSSSPSGPSLKDLQSKKCPELRPTLCIPYGACCNHSEFCYAGICESCFPEEVVKSDLLKWCREQGQHSVAFMRDNSCRLACQNKFTPHELSVLNNTIVYEERYEKAKDLQIEQKGYTPDAFGLTAFILVILLMLLILIYMKGKCLIQKLKSRTMPQQNSTTAVETDLECANGQRIDCNDKTKPHSKLEDSTNDVENLSHRQDKGTFTKAEIRDIIQTNNVIQPKGNANTEGDLHRPQIFNICQKCLNSNLTNMDDPHDVSKELIDTDRERIIHLPKGTIKRKDQERDFLVHCPYNEQTNKPAEPFIKKKKNKLACEAFGSAVEIEPLMDKSVTEVSSNLQSPFMSSLNAVSPSEEKLFVESLDDSSIGMYRHFEVHLERKNLAKESLSVLQSNELRPPAKGIDTLTEGPDNTLDREKVSSEA